MVVTSLKSLLYIPFVPSNPFIYAAYHYHGAGHDDATKHKELGNVNTIFATRELLFDEINSKLVLPCLVTFSDDQNR